jgi:hypothetical protein
LVGNEGASPRAEYSVDSFCILWQVQLLSFIHGYLPNEPYRLGLKLLMCSKIAFNENLEGIANNFRVLIAQLTNALLELRERLEVIVETASYQPGGGVVL